MIRPFLWEASRYPGGVSQGSDSAFDRPFQWGTRRIGPDLARVGGKYPHSWHSEHMIDPRAVSPGSMMPSYAHLVSASVDFEALPAKVAAHARLGVPYAENAIATAPTDARAQAERLATELREELVGQVNATELAASSKLIALIAYLQRLGQAPSVAAPIGDEAAGQGEQK